MGQSKEKLQPLGQANETLDSLLATVKAWLNGEAKAKELRKRGPEIIQKIFEKGFLQSDDTFTALKVILIFDLLNESENPEFLNLAEILRSQIEKYLFDRPLLVKALLPYTDDVNLKKQYLNELKVMVSSLNQIIEVMVKRAETMRRVGGREANFLDPKNPKTTAGIYLFMANTEDRYNSYKQYLDDPLEEAIAVFYPSTGTLSHEEEVKETIRLVNQVSNAAVLQLSSEEPMSKLYERGLALPGNVANLLFQAHTDNHVVRDYLTEKIGDTGLSLSDLLSENNIEVFTQKVMAWLTALPRDDIFWFKLGLFFLSPLKADYDQDRSILTHDVHGAAERVFVFHTMLSEKLLLPSLYPNEEHDIALFDHFFTELVRSLPPEDLNRLTKLIVINMLTAFETFTFFYPDLSNQKTKLAQAVDAQFSGLPNPFLTSGVKTVHVIHDLHIAQQIYDRFPQLQKIQGFHAFVLRLENLSVNLSIDATTEIANVLTTNLGANYYEGLLKHREEVEDISQNITEDFTLVDYWPNTTPFEIVFSEHSFERQIGFYSVEYKVGEMNEPVYFKLNMQSEDVFIGAIDLNTGEFIELNVDFAQHAPQYEAFLSILQLSILTNLHDRLVKAEEVLDDQERDSLAETGQRSMDTPRKNKKRQPMQLPAGTRRYTKEQREQMGEKRHRRTSQWPVEIGMHPMHLAGWEDTQHAYEVYIETQSEDETFRELLRSYIVGMRHISSDKAAKYPERLKAEGFANPFYVDDPTKREEGAYEQTVPFIYFTTWKVKHRRPKTPAPELFHTTYRGSGRTAELLRFTEGWILGEDDWGGEEIK